MKSNIQVSVGIFISLSTSAALFISGQETISSLTVGLLGSILSFLVAIKSDIFSSEEKIMKSIKMAKEVNKSEVLVNTVTPVITSFNKIDPKKHILVEEAIESLKISQGIISSASEGKIVVDNEERRSKILIKLFNNSKEQVKAASYPGRWTGKMNESVFQSNISAISRGVEISRIYICRSFDNKEFDIVKYQLKKGVKSYIVDENDILPKNRRHMIIFDSEVATLPNYDKEGNNNGGLVSFNQKDISHISKLWESLKIHSTFVESEEQLKKLFEETRVLSY